MQVKSILPYIQLIVPAFFALLFFIIARIMSSWAAIAYAMMMLLSMGALIFAGIFSFIEWRTQRVKLWVRILLIPVFYVLSYVVLFALVQTTI